MPSSRSFLTVTGWVLPVAAFLACRVVFSQLYTSECGWQTTKDYCNTDFAPFSSHGGKTAPSPSGIVCDDANYLYPIEEYCNNDPNNKPELEYNPDEYEHVEPYVGTPSNRVKQLGTEWCWREYSCVYDEVEGYCYREQRGDDEDAPTWSTLGC